MPLVPEGTRLRQGSTYADLGAENPVAFTAGGGVHVQEDDRYVAKEDVDRELWNALAAVGPSDETYSPERRG